MLYFNCDYMEGAHPQILQKLMETNMVQTVGYGEDEYCDQARAVIREICKAPKADVHLLVGGTQTNFTFLAAAMRCCASRSMASCCSWVMMFTRKIREAISF